MEALTLSFLLLSLHGTTYCVMSSRLPSRYQTLSVSTVVEDPCFDVHSFAAAKYAATVIKPKVRKMDDTMTMDPEIIKGLFDLGVSKRVY